MGESQKIMQVRSARQVPVRVRLLDDDIFNHSVDKRAVGWILFDKVCEHLNILEKDYFGLNYYDAAGEKFWLNSDKKIAKQMKGQNWDFNFEVKFYPADPSQLAEDLTRYQLCLQIRRDIVNERLPCSFVTYTLLGSYTAQSELGDYDTEEFGSGYKYLKDIQFAPHQDKELLMKIAELHRQHKGETPEEAELHFLENAKKLAMFGVELHGAKDAEGRDIQLGVCASGLIVYKDKQQINRFVWPKVLKISYRRNKYYIKIRPGEFEEFASLIGFKLATVKFAKRLWKISVEHHSFFRFREPEEQKSVSFLPRFGSRFRYSGRTQFQTRQVVAEENRDSPFFDRVLSKRGTFGGRTNNMRKRDEDRQQRRDELRRQPYPPPQTKLPPSEPRKEPSEPKRTPPEPKHAPPVAPKPDKPRPSPRGGSVDDIASLDREHTGSLNDSFDDVPDRKSRMEKIHAVATPLAALMQSKKEHEQHEEEHHRKEANHDKDDRRRDDRDDRDDRRDDDHDRSYDHEVGKSSQTNHTNRAYKTDRTDNGKGDHYTQVNNTERVRKSKSMGDNLGQIKNYLFSYPASSAESITSHGDYDTSKDCIEGINGRVGSVQNLRKNDKNSEVIEPEHLSHSVSAEIVYSEIPRSHYAEIGPPKSEGIYAEIDEVKSQVSKMRSKRSDTNDLYAEIPDVNDKSHQEHEKPKVKIHGRKSKYFKENQKSETNQNIEFSSNQSMSIKCKQHSKPNEFSDTVKVNSKTRDSVQIKSNNSKVSQDLLGAKPKTPAQMPIYAKINKQKNVNCEKTAKTGAKITDKNNKTDAKFNEVSQEDNNAVPNLNEGKKLKEELKMYILTPEKVNKNAQSLKTTFHSDNKANSFSKSDFTDTCVHENVNTDTRSEPYHIDPTISVESSREETQNVATKMISDKTDSIGEREDHHLKPEPLEDDHKNKGLNSEAENDEQTVEKPENIIKVLSFSSLEDGDSVHNTSSVVSDPEQVVISELEAEGVEMDIRERIESSSLSCLYKLTFDGNSNNGTDSLNVDDEELERFSDLSSASSDFDVKESDRGDEGDFNIETGNDHYKNFLAEKMHSLDDELERFSTISTDSSEFEGIIEANSTTYGTSLDVPIAVKSRKKTKAKGKKVNNINEGKFDELIPCIEHESKKSRPIGTSKNDCQNYPDNIADTVTRDARNQSFAKKGESLDKDFGKISNEATKNGSKKKNWSKKSFEIEVYDEEPYNRHRFKADHKELKSDVQSADMNLVEGETMDFFQKPKLLDGSSLFLPSAEFSCKNKNTLNESIEAFIMPEEMKDDDKLARKSVDGSLNDHRMHESLDVKPEIRKVEGETLNEKHAEFNGKQQKVFPETCTPTIDSTKPESLSVESVNDEEAYTPVKFDSNTDTKQNSHNDVEKIKKRLVFQPESNEKTFIASKTPIIQGSKVFIEEKINEKIDEERGHPAGNPVLLKEKDETSKTDTTIPRKEIKQLSESQIGGSAQQTPKLTSFYSTLSNDKSDTSKKRTFDTHDSIGIVENNERIQEVQQVPLSTDLKTKSRIKETGAIKEKVRNVGNKYETRSTPEQVPKQDSEKIPILIKDSKVFTDNKPDFIWKRMSGLQTEKDEHFPLKEIENLEDEEQSSNIIMGNIKSFQNSETSGKMSTLPRTIEKGINEFPSKSESSRIEKSGNPQVAQKHKRFSKKEIDDTTCTSKLHVKSETIDIANKVTKPEDKCDDSFEQSFESTTFSTSHISGHANKQKKKILPGVIHMINPCPSGWIEGGLKTSPKKPKAKKKEKASKYTVSVLDFVPQEIPTSTDLSLSYIDSNLTDPELEREDEDDIEKGVDEQDDPRKMLENAQQTDLLCQRVWKKYIKGRKTTTKGIDSQGKDRDDKNEENMKDDDFKTQVEKGPWGDQPRIPKTEETNMESQLYSNSCLKKEGNEMETRDVTVNYGRNVFDTSECFGEEMVNSEDLSEEHVKNEKNAKIDNELQSEDKLSFPAEMSETAVDLANDVTDQDEIDCVKIEKLQKGSMRVENDNYMPLSDKQSLHLKLESLGLGDVKIDEDAVNQQSLELQQIDFNVEENSDSESGPSETDSESGDEIELACFEMPGLTVNPTPDSFITTDSFKDVDVMQQFAIDCSFEDVKSYKMGEKEQESTSILCECNFKNSEPGKGTVCNLHKSGIIADGSHGSNVPDVIDDTPHIPVKSNLKTKAKSESNLSERRVRFEENLPVYKSSNNLGFRKHLFANKRTDGNEDEKMKYIEDFITCLFDTEPRNIGLRSNDTISSDLIDDDRPVGHDTELGDYKASDRAIGNDKPIGYERAVGADRLPGYGWSVNDDRLLGFDRTLDDDGSLCGEKLLYNRPLDDDAKLNKPEYPTKKSPKIIKPVSGGNPTSGSRPTLVRVSTQQRANENIPVMIPVVKQNSQKMQNGDKTIPTILLTSPTGEINCSENFNKKDNPDSFTHRNSRECSSDIYEGESDMKIDTAEASDKVSRETNNAKSEDFGCTYSASCVAELKTEKDNLYGDVSELRKHSPNPDKKIDFVNQNNTKYTAANDLNSQIPKNVSVNKTELSNGNPQISSVSVMQDSQSAELESCRDFQTKKKTSASSDRPRDQITKYTFSVNEDSDSESPKIKTVTYEYVTEYKLNNVKIQYQQNRKTQTDLGISRVNSEAVASTDKSKDVTYGDVKDLRQEGRKTKHTNENDTKIIVEEVMEKSVCYPLGPSHGKSSCNGCTSDIDVGTEQQIQKSVTVANVPRFNMEMQNATLVAEKEKQEMKYISGGYNDKKKDIKEVVMVKSNNKKIVEHNSEKFFWQSCQTKIPFKPTMQTSKLPFNEDNLDKEAQLTRNWTFCNVEETCPKGSVSKVSGSNHDGFDKSYASLPSDKENLPVELDKGDALNSDKSKDGRNFLLDGSARKELLGNRTPDQQEILQGKDRLRQFCKRKLLKRYKHVEESYPDESKETSDMNESDYKDGPKFEMVDEPKFEVDDELKFEIDDEPKFEIDDEPKINADLCSWDITGHSSGKTAAGPHDRRHNNDGETILAALMQERLPEINVHDQAQETMFVVQAVAAIALGTVLVFLLPYVG